MDPRSLSGAPAPAKGRSVHRGCKKEAAAGQEPADGLRLANPCARLIDFIPRRFRGGSNRALEISNWMDSVMFARVCELHFNPEKRAEVFKMLREEIVPMLEQCDGFFDEIALELDTHPRKFYAISLWHDERDAERYHKECFPKIYDILEPFLAAPISVKHGTIDETISKKLATPVAA